jgi:hypothetical protein
MKSYTQYLAESKKTWKFCIKTIHQLTDDQCDRIEKHLIKYDSTGLGAEKKTILQSTPRDFPQHRGYEVYMYEFETNLIATGNQIANEINSLYGLSANVLKVKSEHEPDEDVVEEKNDSLLADPDYKEAEDVNSDEHHGDKYNTSFLEELAKLRKEKEKDNE